MKKMYVIMCLGILATGNLWGCRKKIAAEGSEPAYILTAAEDSINPAFGGYYVAVPPGYASASKEFPLLFFLHGQGQMGNGREHLEYLLHDGIGKWIRDGRLPGSFRSGFQQRSFVIVSPQYSRIPTTAEVLQCIDYMIRRYRIEPGRVYLSGLSLGGRLLTLAAAAQPRKFAALVPIAGVAPDPGMAQRCADLAESHLPVWELHNAQDPLADVNDAKRFVRLMHEDDPEGGSKITIFNTYGHDAWTAALDPSYREDNMNIYEWMLQFSR